MGDQPKTMPITGASSGIGSLRYTSGPDPDRFR